MDSALQNLEQAFSCLQAPFIAINMGIGIIWEGNEQFDFLFAHDGVKVVGADHRNISQNFAHLPYQFAFSIGIGRFCDHRPVESEVDAIQRTRFLQGIHYHTAAALVYIRVDDTSAGKANSDRGDQFHVWMFYTFHKTTDKTPRMRAREQCFSSLYMNGIHGVILLWGEGVGLV